MSTSNAMRIAPLRPYRLVSFLTWLTCLFYNVRESCASSSINESAFKDTMVEQIGATLMGESALIDRETGRVIWEGRSTSTLSESVHPYLTNRGFNHIKASLLTSVLALVLLSYLANWIRRRLEEPAFDGRSESFPSAFASFVAQWTILKVPHFDLWFVLAAIGLYLLEAYTCNTRRYLNNAISSPTEVEEYVESLRSKAPIITWKVRSFHYEARKWLLPVLYPIQLLQRIADRQTEAAAIPPLFRKKIVTKVAQGQYEYTSYQDSTTSGVWKRPFNTSSRMAPFTKISLCKRIVLSNGKARNDYFSQQAKFVTEEGQCDEFAEFATHIEVEGFNPRMLAVRAVEGIPSAKLFRIQLFWLFTLLGLTLPFRIWFSRHCEEVRVTVVKETSSDKKSSSWSTKGWFSRKEEESTGEERFRRQMQDLALYHKTDRNATASEEDAQLQEDMEVARMAANLTNQTLTEPVVTDIVDSESNTTETKTNTTDSQTLP